MDKASPVQVRGDGTVILGSTVSCDGFSRHKPLRVQSVWHERHLRQFGASKGHQDVVMSKPTFDLLTIGGNEDLPFRSNIHGVSPDEALEFSGTRVQLKPSGYVLGSTQVLVTESNGLGLGYSSLFSWPTPDGVIKCDELVVDLAGVNRINTTQDSCLEPTSLLIELADEYLSSGPITLVGPPALLSSALVVLSGRFAKVPVVAGPGYKRYAEVWSKHDPGFPMPVAEENHHIPGHKDLPYFMFYDPSESIRGMGVERGCTINLETHAASGRPRKLRVGDFVWNLDISVNPSVQDVIEYAKASKARSVIVNSDSYDAALATSIGLKESLGVEVSLASRSIRRAWDE